MWIWIKLGSIAPNFFGLRKKLKGLSIKPDFEVVSMY